MMSPLADIFELQARIFTCAPGLVKLINGGSWADIGLPECFEVSEKRLRRDNPVVSSVRT